MGSWIMWRPEQARVCARAITTPHLCVYVHDARACGIYLSITRCLPAFILFLLAKFTRETSIVERVRALEILNSFRLCGSYLNRRRHLDLNVLISLSHDVT